MTSWFRSKGMVYSSLIINEDAAYNCLKDLGNSGVISFTDLNPHLTPFQRRYISTIKRCDELERKLRFFSGEIVKFGLPTSNPTSNIDSFLSDPTNGLALSGVDGSVRGSKSNGNADGNAALLQSLESTLDGYHSQLLELNSYSQKLTSEYNEKVELQEVLLKGRAFFWEDGERLLSSTMGNGNNNTNSSSSSALAIGGGRTDSLLSAELGASTLTNFGSSSVPVENSMKFSSITGVIPLSDRPTFERMLFRSTRGNCFVRFSPIDAALTDPITGELVEKEVFIIFFKGDSIESKVCRICDSFNAHRYNLPPMDDSSSVDKMLSENAGELVDSHNVLSKNQDMRYRLCSMLSAKVETWNWIVLREKGIYHSLNMFKSDVTGMLRGEGWIVATALPLARESILRAHSNMDRSMPSLLELVPLPWPTPPTHFETNEFTYAYQEFVNTYGVPRYREANPALFTAATFPFLFGVMYGDIGHGSCLLVAGLYLMYTFDKNKKYDEMMGGVMTARFMIAAMGFFGVYAGLLYNDFFSLGLNLFGSRYVFEGQDTLEVEGGAVAAQTSDYGSGESVYPFGMDPVWHVSTNELLFFNSFKMKTSVILGILQMFGGTLLKGLNAIYFEEKLDFFFEFLPMVVFASSLFLYMIVLIVMKWGINWQSRMLSATCLDPAGDNWGLSTYTDGDWTNCGSDSCTPWGLDCETAADLTTATLCPLDFGGSGDGCQPPNLINSLINIALAPGSVEEPMYAGQAGMQNFLLLLAFASVPILLLGKPIMISRGQKAAHHGSSASDDQSSEHSDTPLHAPGGEDHDDEHGGFGEIVIHQAIETIEFVLGMVSNTASYLRLWALSLAHSKLAGVFWEKCMLSTINMNFFAAFLGFGMFAAVTTAVLLMMDVLECFLHALRLHWVEFQNKFYKADGYSFQPFSFKAILKESSL